MEGYIKLHRKMLENPVVCKDAETLAIWVYLLMNATYKPYDTIFKGKRITLQPRTTNNWININSLKARNIS